MAKNENQDTPPQVIVIKPPRFERAAFVIRGLSQYVQNRFGNKEAIINERLLEASERKKQRKAEKDKPKDMDADFRRALHETADGHYGIPAAAFRSGMIDACRLVPGITMTGFKLSAWVLGDGVCMHDDCDLVYLTGEPTARSLPVKLPGPGHTMDIRTRAHFHEWGATVRVEYDADQLSLESLANLMMRVGMQVGVGEGRNYSKSSGGQGWGRFEIVEVQTGG